MTTTLSMGWTQDKAMLAAARQQPPDAGSDGGMAVAVALSGHRGGSPVSTSPRTGTGLDGDRMRVGGHNGVGTTGGARPLLHRATAAKEPEYHVIDQCERAYYQIERCYT